MSSIIQNEISDTETLSQKMEDLEKKSFAQPLSKIVPELEQKALASENSHTSVEETSGISEQIDILGIYKDGIAPVPNGRLN